MNGGEAPRFLDHSGLALTEHPRYNARAQIMDSTFEVELVDVSKRYGKAVAVEHVSLGIRPGEFMTLLGPSGCGKTTLLRMVAGFTYPDEGKVFLSGQEVEALPPFKRDVTTVFQQYALFPHLSVFENVAFGLRRRRTSDAEIAKRVGESLDLVRLSGFESRMPSELSGGQQQRVALARALIVKPRVLLLDEPLAALDLKLRRQMQIELKSLQREVGICFIFVTHDQEEALTMSDRVAVMNVGRIEQLGEPDEIYEKPRTEFVADFIGMSNILEGTVLHADEIDLYGSRVRLSSITAAPGSRVKLMVRPEKVRMEPGSSAGVLSGTIESGVYLGDSTKWLVAVGKDRVITVVEQNRDHGTKPETRVGEQVSINWERECAVVLNNQA